MIPYCDRIFRNGSLDTILHPKSEIRPIIYVKPDGFPVSFVREDKKPSNVGKIKEESGAENAYIGTGNITLNKGG